MYRILLIGLFGVTIPINAERVNYEGYRLYSVTPQNKKQLEQLNVLKERFDYDFWKDSNRINSTSEVLVRPRDNKTFHQLLKSVDLKPEISIDNVQKLMEENVAKDRAAGFDWNAYYRLSNIYTWLDTLAQFFPKKVSIINLECSAQGKYIKGVKVSFGTGKKSVFLEGGIHAREWISPAVVTYMLNEIIFNDNTAVRSLVEQFDWYVFPVFNPDGYEYTFTSDRLWRKSRQSQNWDWFGLFCKGIDLNRNWDFHWAENNGGSSSSCSEVYYGTSPFSGKEASALSKYMSGNLKDKLEIYLSFHSYGQYIMPPYGYTKQPPSNYNRLLKIGQMAAAAIKKRYGTVYEVGNSIDFMNYVSSGTSHDWAAGVLNAPISYTFELPDKNTYKFLLPARFIIPTGEETFDGLLSILQSSLVVIKP